MSEMSCGEFRNYQQTENEVESEIDGVQYASESELGRKA
jgi:hypothetical protein